MAGAPDEERSIRVVVGPDAQAADGEAIQAMNIRRTIDMCTQSASVLRDGVVNA
jgi:hypothetical protein